MNSNPDEVDQNQHHFSNADELVKNFEKIYTSNNSPEERKGLLREAALNFMKKIGENPTDPNVENKNVVVEKDDTESMFGNIFSNNKGGKKSTKRRRKRRGKRGKTSRR